MKASTLFRPRFWLALLSFVCLAAQMAEDGREGVDYAVIKVSRLQCTVGNNRALGEHRAWYNGIFSLLSPDCREMPFVTSFSGLNLEHYFDARPASDDRAILFEPRAAPMEFRLISSTTAELRQAPTPVYGVESTTRFELHDPYYLDMEFTCVPRKPELAGNFLGVFWASYINDPEDKSIHFLAAGSTLAKPVWVQFLTQEHNRDSTVRNEADSTQIKFDTEKPTLWNSISPLRYSAPFFYGRFRNMVLIYIFKPDKRIRFSHSPSGGGATKGGDGSNPAWDFQFIVPDYRVGDEYRLKARLVYKPWKDRKDVLLEVSRYLDGL
ncbi:MAG: hypothetical protein EHM61_08605 [Acidobacteria bacterium]|nr:MAG: hypothetical protein EHM61_08605 [Acidobacteriota bacterium]